MKNLNLIFFLVIFVFSYFKSSGQGATCADAIELLPTDIPYFYSGTTTGAGNEYTNGRGCSDTRIGGEDFVFQYISPGNEVLRLELQSLSTINDYAAYVFDGCPDDPLTSCVGYDEGDIPDSALIETLHLIDADTYFIVISSFPSSATSFDFEIFIERPLGNICENAVQIPVFATDYTYVGTTQGFGDDYDNGRGCSNTYINARDFVFEYNSPGDEVLRLQVKNLDSLFNFGVYVIEGCPDDPASKCFAFDDADWPDSAFIQTLHFDTAGTYYIIVSDWDNGPDFYNFELYIDRPIGNICENALVIPPFAVDYSYIGTTQGFGDDYDDGRGCPDTYINASDFVFEYSSPGDEVLRVRLKNLDSLYNFAVYVMEGCPSDASSKCFAFDLANYPDSAFIQTLHFDTAGNYYIIVSDWDNGPDFYNFELYIDRPTGNICENALVIPQFTTDYLFVGTTQGFGDDYDDGHGCPATYINASDFVFEYTSLGDEVLRVKLKNLDSLSDFGVYVFDGCPDEGSTNCFAFDDADYPDSAFIQTLHFDTAGTYYIIVSDWDNGPDFYNFELYIDRPIGNICENAVVIPAFEIEYSFTGTTRGFGNDYVDARGCSNTFINANDFVFEYNSPGDEVLRVRLKNLDTLYDFAVYAMRGCPSDPTSQCYQYDDADLLDSAYIQTLYLDSAGTYYIIVSDWINGLQYYDFDLYIDRPLGNICENAIPIDEFPFKDINNTFGLGNDYISASGCSNTYINTHDAVYEFYAEQGAYINVSLESIDLSNNFGLYLIEGCPDTSSNCIGHVNGDGADSIVLDLTSCLDEGFYYIIVSMWSGSGQSFNYELNVDGFSADILTTEMSGFSDDKIICFDEVGIANVLLNAAGDGGNVAGNYSYNWSTSETTQSINDMPSSMMTYTVTISDDNGCKAYAEEIILINPEMNLALDEMDNSGINNDQIICFDEAGNSAVTITGAANGGNGPYSYLWDNPSASTDTFITESTAVTTTYTLAITDVVGCTVSENLEIAINPELTAIIAESDNSGVSDDAIVCFDQAGIENVDLTASGFGGSLSYSYLWNDASASTTMSITENPVVNTDYYVTLTDGVGCAVTANQLVTINSEIVSSLAETDNSGTSDDAIVCYSDAGSANVNLLAEATGGTGAYSYVWNNMSASTMMSITETPATNTSYIVTITDLVGCDAVAIQLITINPELTASLSHTENSGVNNDALICFDEAGSANVNITANGVGGTSGYSYLWDNMSASTTMSISEIPFSNTDFNVIITDNVGCEIENGMSISINPEIILTAAAYENMARTISIDTLCFSNAGSQTIYFSANASGGDGSFSYLWNDPSNTPAVNMEDMPITSRDYHVTVTDVRGCVNDALASIIVNEEILVDLMATENSSTINDDQICPRDVGVESVTIDAMANGGSGNLIYQWNNVSMSTTPSITETPLSTTMYNVTVSEASANLACQAASSIQIQVDYLTNTWVGAATGNWNDAANNWSLGRIPNDCDHVVISNGKNVTILAGETGRAYTLFVDDNAELHAIIPADLHVVAPE